MPAVGLCKIFVLNRTNFVFLRASEFGKIRHDKQKPCPVRWQCGASGHGWLGDTPESARRMPGTAQAR